MIVSGARYYIRLIPGRANYVVVVDGQFYLVSGTSASSPVVGSMITMINDARLAVGKGPVGKFRGLSSELHEAKLNPLI
jgi:tripeptidyl-peptidase I